MRRLAREMSELMLMATGAVIAATLAGWMLVAAVIWLAMIAWTMWEIAGRLFR